MVIGKTHSVLVFVDLRKTTVLNQKLNVARLKTEECWQEMRNHSPFGWVKFKNGESGYIHFETVRDDGIYFNSISTTFEESLDYYTFIDGSPFGVKEE